MFAQWAVNLSLGVSQLVVGKLVDNLKDDFRGHYINHIQPKLAAITRAANL